jgi:hypothetical protein
MAQFFVDYYSMINSVLMILITLLILYITSRSKITKDKRFGYSFWIINILSFACLMWIGWKYPIWRIIILGFYLSAIISIYYIHFRQRIKTILDYLKLCWLIYFAIDNLIINSMRFMYITNEKTSLINKDFTNNIDLLFDFGHLLFLYIIAYKIFNSEKKE